MNYPTVEINNEFPKRVFYSSSVNLDTVPPEPNQNYTSCTTFRADLPDIIQPTDDTQNVSWHIVSIGMTPNAIHNPPAPSEPLAGGTIHYRLIADKDLYRNSLLYGKFENPPSSVLSSPTPTVRPNPGEWPNEDIATLAQYYDTAHLARIALMTQVYQTGATPQNDFWDISVEEPPVYDHDTVDFRIIPTRLRRATRGDIPQHIPGQPYYNLRQFENGLLEPDVGLTGSLFHYWVQNALPALEAALESEMVELEEPYFPSREKFLSRLLEKANLSSLLQCSVPDLPDDLSNRVTLELREHATVSFFRTSPGFAEVLHSIRARINDFCYAYVSFCMDPDESANRIGIHSETATPLVTNRNNVDYYLSRGLFFPMMEDSIPVFPVSAPTDAGDIAAGDYDDFMVQNQTEDLTSRMLEYLFSITVIRNIDVLLNPSAKRILGDQNNANNDNWILNLSRNGMTSQNINTWGAPTPAGQFLPLWFNGQYNVSLQFQKDCSIIKSFTKSSQANVVSYTPPIPTGEYLYDRADPGDILDVYLWVRNVAYHLALPFTLQSVLDYYKKYDQYFWQRYVMDDGMWYISSTFNIDLTNLPEQDWYTFDRSTGVITWVSSDVFEQVQDTDVNGDPVFDVNGDPVYVNGNLIVAKPAIHNTAFRLPQTPDAVGGYENVDLVYDPLSMAEDFGLFNRLFCYQNTIPIFKTLTNSTAHCKYQYPNSTFLLYSYTNYLRFSGQEIGLTGYYNADLVTAERAAPFSARLTALEMSKFRRYYLGGASPFIQWGNAPVPIYAFENNFIGLEWVDVTFRNLMNNTMVASPASRYSRSSQISTRLFMSTDSRSYVQNSQVSTNMCFGSIELRTLEYLQIDILDPSFRHSLQNARLYFEIEFNQRTVTEQESEKTANFQNWTPAAPDELEQTLASVSGRKRSRQTVRIVS